MRFNFFACILGLAICQKAAALDAIDGTEDFMPEFCQNVPQEVRQTHFDMPGDLPTARNLLCALSELVKEMEDEEKENLKAGLEKRDDFGFGCSLWNDEGCGRRRL